MDRRQGVALSADEARQNDLVTVTINGTEIQAEKGRLLIDVAEQAGVFVPRFCYHPGMKSVAVCRMCLVQVEGQRKLLPACATPIDDGMNVNTVGEEAVDAQRGMLEFLLINHPLDCPICDRAGECPLQDQTYAHGPGSSRYVEPKRTYEKALEISDLVVLDRERCVLCWRCVRFSDEIAGDRFIQLVDRGAGTQILTFSDEPFDSYFSGNTIQICPVGALTSKPYRFVSRPWDLEAAPSVCAYCAVGCPITNESRAGKMVRVQALPNERVNDFWICDKGRFAYHYVSSEDRLDTPLVRDGDDFVTASWGEALAKVAEGLKDKKNVGLIAGGHLTTEDAHAIARLAKRTLKTRNVDHRIQDAGAPYEVVAETLGVAGSTATIEDLERADHIVWVGPDPKEQLPVLFLRIRKAVLYEGTELTVVSPRRLSLDSFATEVVRCPAGGEAEALRALSPENAIVCWCPTPGADETETVRAAAALAASSGGRLLVGVPHAGSQGMNDMGVLPTVDAGYETGGSGLDTRGILEAAASGELDALLVFGADPITDFPDASLARRALESKAFTVVVELFPTETVTHADVVLPSAAYAEREGTFTNLERRLQKIERLLPPPGSAKEPWAIAQDVAQALGDDWKWRDFNDVWSDIKSSVPTHKDVDVEALAQDMPPSSLQYESGFGQAASDNEQPAVAGPGAQYPKGYRAGAPFQTGQNWPLSWELRAFEAEQRPGYVPPLADGAASAATANGAGTEGGAEEDGQGGREQGSFVLLTGRHIYDEGAMVSRSAALRRIQRKPYVELNDEDAKELDVADGDEVTLSANGETVTLRAEIADIARGAVYVPYDQQGFRANKLIAGPRPTVAVTKA